MTKSEEKYCGLIHELLKNFKLNQISFVILKIFEAMQIIHFTMREEFDFIWKSSLPYYLDLVLNYISFDYLIKKSPSIFFTILIITVCISLLTILSLIFISCKVSRDIKTPTYIKLIVPLINLILILFKTILQIPCTYILIIGLVYSIR